MPDIRLDRRALIPAIGLLALLPATALRPAPLLAAAAPGSAAEDDGPGSGTLMLRGLKQTTVAPAVRLGTDMDVTITGTIARIRVTQAFRNTSNGWMEARYLYPLPDDGAVDTLKMVVAQRVIVGKIARRDAAKAMYEQAKDAGRKAGLVEQQRPNMFTTNVANVGPGETVLIRIEYQAPVAQANGTYALRLPLVVAPRYTPPHTLISPAAIADANVVTAAPVMNPHSGTVLNPTSITVHLRPGFGAANVISRYHKVAVTGRDDDRTIRLATDTVPADRDFELDWRSSAAESTLGLFRERTAHGDYVMATITPPADLSALPTPPREMVFVIDNSGSMGGASMEEAKASLLHALATLRPQDSFNIVRFDDTLTQLFARSVPATSDRLAVARRFAQGLQAAGGTEMLPALRAALKDAAASGGPRTLRQVIFLTDGEISNEQEMLATLGRDGGRSHIFFVGIGSAPNDYLMRRMATLGGGTYTHVGTPEEVAARMMPLLDILGHPAMQDLSVKVDDGTLDLTPRRLPDLYPGEPLVLLGRTDRLRGTLTVSGTIGAQHWERTIDLAQAEDSPAVAKLWARRRIDDVEADRSIGRTTAEAADEAIAQLGLAHGLVTSQTSLVAVDDTPARPAGETLRREDLPINLPAGWDFDTLFGAHRDGGSRAADMPPQSPVAPASALELPQTATGFLGTIAEGLALLIGGLFALLLRHRGVRA